jgi:hypothetical protein
MDKFDKDMKRQAKLLKRGPRGRAIYDTQGFEFGYEKVLKSRYPPKTPGRGTKAYMKMLEQDQSDKRIIEHTMGLPENGLFGTVRDAVQDRVARDVGVQWHKVVCIIPDTGLD